MKRPNHHHHPQVGYPSDVELAQNIIDKVKKTNEFSEDEGILIVRVLGRAGLLPPEGEVVGDTSEKPS